MSFYESIVEDAALEWFWKPGYAVRHGSKQSRTLDTLLPKLLRGELSVAEFQN